MPINETRKNTIIPWLICGLGALFYSYEYFLRISPSVMESSIRNHFDLSATGFGALSAMYYYAYVPMQLPVGILMDRYGPKLLITLACMVCVIGTFLFGATSLIWVAGLGRFLVGFGSAFAFVGVLKLATIWLPENKLAMISGLAAALGTVGAMVGDNLLGSMVRYWGWHTTLVVTGFAGVFLTAFLWFGLKDSKKDSEPHGTVGTFKESFKDFAMIIKNHQIWINGLFGCLVYLPTTVFAELWGISYLKNAAGMTPAAADFANSLLFLGFTFGAPLMGFISDKLKRRRLPMFVGATLASITMVIIIYVPGLSNMQIDILLFCLGLFYSVQSIVFAVGRELSPNEAAGTAMATTNMIVMLGAMLLQPLVGRLLDFSLSRHLSLSEIDASALTNLQKYYSVTDYEFALFVIPVGIFIAAILTFFLKETHADAPK